MSELELGQASIVYEDPDDGQTEETVENEQLVYARDHWMIKSGTDDQGNDLMRQIPATRVYHVERNVERFEEQARTVRRRVETLASNLSEKLPVDVGDGQERRRRRESPQTIPIDESAESQSREN